LDRNRFKDSLGLELIDVLLPFLWSSEGTKVREKQLNLKEERSIQILRFNVNLSPEETNVVDFDFLFTVPDQE
jgi:hypothetical protein